MAHPLGNDKLAREKRETARRARRLAQTLVDEDDRGRLTRFADELDAEADALSISVSPVGATIQVQQQQVQQQQAAAAESDVTKEKD